MIKLIRFNSDGVLIEPKHIHFLTFNQLLTLNKQLDPRFYKQIRNRKQYLTSQDYTSVKFIEKLIQKESLKNNPNFSNFFFNESR